MNIIIHNFKKAGFLFSFMFAIFLSTSIVDANAREQVKFLQELRADFERPIDTAIADNGDVYVLDKDLARVLLFSEQGKLKRTFAKQGSAEGHLDQPQSIAISKTGDIIVADTGNSRVQVFNPNGQFSYQLGNSGPLPGEFRVPVSVAVDMMGFIYVADSTSQTISIFSPQGVFLKLQQLDETPQDITFDIEQNLYVLMPSAGKLVKMNPIDGKRKEFTLMDNGRNYMEDAVSISVDNRGDIYLIEDKTHTIKKIDQDSNVLFSFGSQGVGKGQFDRPVGIVADSRGRVFVADSRNKRVQVLEITGSHKVALKPTPNIAPVLDFDHAILSGEHVVDLSLKSDGLYALSDLNGEVLFSGLNATRMIQKSDKETVNLDEPQALIVLKEGKMLVADTGNNRLQFLDSKGDYEYHFGSKGKNAGQFNKLSGIAVDKDGYIYVADSLNHRVQIFNSDGIYLREFGQRSKDIEGLGPERGKFLYPKDLAFDSKGMLYVLDMKNKRIQVFDKEGAFKREIGGMAGNIHFNEPVDIAIDEKDYLYVADQGSHTINILSPEDKLLMEFGSAGKGPSYFPKLSSVATMDGKIYVADYDVAQIKVFNFDPSGIKEQPKVKRIVKREESMDSKMGKSMLSKKAQASKAEIAKKKMPKAVKPIAKANILPKQEMKQVAMPSAPAKAGAPAVQQVATVTAPAIKPVDQKAEYRLSDNKEMLFISKASSPLKLEKASMAKEISLAKGALVDLMIKELSSRFNIPETPIRESLKVESQVLLESKQLKVTISIPRKVQLEQKKISMK